VSGENPGLYVVVDIPWENFGEQRFVLYPLRGPGGCFEQHKEILFAESLQLQYCARTAAVRSLVGVSMSRVGSSSFGWRGLVHVVLAYASEVCLNV
jgi:hypothetical protein